MHAGVLLDGSNVPFPIPNRTNDMLLGNSQVLIIAGLDALHRHGGLAVAQRH